MKNLKTFLTSITLIISMSVGLVGVVPVLAYAKSDSNKQEVKQEAKIAKPVMMNRGFMMGNAFWKKFMNWNWFGSNGNPGNHNGNDQNKNDNENETDQHHSTTTPPILRILAISRIQASVVNTTSETISWNTNKVTTGSLLYGTTQQLTTGNGTTVNDTASSTTHSLTLTGLTAGVTYFYKITASDGLGNTTNSAVRSFNTLTPSAPLPIISSIQTSGIGTTAAKIGWNTDSATTGSILYGTVLPLTTLNGTTVNDSTSTTTHSLNLSSLAAGTTYYFMVSATSGSGTSNSAVYAFSTLALPTPAANILYSFPTSITANSTTLIWVTDQLTNSKLWISTSSSVDTSGSPSASSSVLGYFHSLTVNGLTASTAYNYIFSSTNSSGNTATSSQSSFTTTP